MPGQRISDLEGERIQWRKSVRGNITNTMWRAVGTFGLLELSANFRELTRASMGSNVNTPYVPHVRLDGDISDAEAAVIVTAMVLLVATINVAIAATSWGVGGPGVSREVTRGLWAESLSTAAQVAAATATAIACSHVTKNPGLAVVLGVMAGIAVTVTAAVQQRNKDDALSVLRRRDLEAEIDSLDRRIAVERARVGTASSRVQRTVRYSLALTLLAVLLFLALYTSYLLSASLTPSAYFQRPRWPQEARYVFLAAYIFCLFWSAPLTLLYAVAYRSRRSSDDQGLTFLLNGYNPSNTAAAREAVSTPGSRPWVSYAALGALILWAATCPSLAIAASDHIQWWDVLSLSLVTCGLPLICMVLAWKRGTGPGRLVIRSTLAALESTRFKYEQALLRLQEDGVQEDGGYEHGGYEVLRLRSNR